MRRLSEEDIWFVGILLLIFGVGTAAILAIVAPHTDPRFYWLAIVFAVVAAGGGVFAVLWGSDE